MTQYYFVVGKGFNQTVSLEADIQVKRVKKPGYDRNRADSENMLDVGRMRTRITRNAGKVLRATEEAVQQLNAAQMRVDEARGAYYKTLEDQRQLQATLVAAAEPVDFDELMEMSNVK